MWECSMWQPGWQSCVKLTESYRVPSVVWASHGWGNGIRNTFAFGFWQRHLWQKQTILTVKAQTMPSDTHTTPTFRLPLHILRCHLWCSAATRAKTELALRLPRPQLWPCLPSDSSRMQHTLPCLAFWALLQLHLGQAAKELCARQHFKSYWLVREAAFHQTPNYPMLLLT